MQPLDEWITRASLSLASISQWILDVTGMTKREMGVLAVVIMIIAYTIYIWQTARAEGVEPHPYSWLVWGLVTFVAYFVQRDEHGGAGSWVVLLTALSCFFIGGFSLHKHERHFPLFDKIFFGAGLLLGIFYLAVRDPTQSAIFATVVDVLGYGPTINKGWTYPRKDSITSFLLNSLKFIPSVFALESYSLATWLYPLTLVIVNAFVAFMLGGRRLAQR